ncbi:MAG: hypothetical protein HZB33_13020 [Nitrospirae bacterium]|nr:hypothetical protein [Nitrospirota bacterium]
MKKHDDQNIDKKSGSLCTVRYHQIPDYVACPNCGIPTEFWSASDQTLCFFCGQVIFLCETTVH